MSDYCRAALYADDELPDTSHSGIAALTREIEYPVNEKFPGDCVISLSREQKDATPYCITQPRMTSLTGGHIGLCPSSENYRTRRQGNRGTTWRILDANSENAIGDDYPEGQSTPWYLEGL